jgi:hypothetical protein
MGGTPTRTTTGKSGAKTRKVTKYVKTKGGKYKKVVSRVKIKPTTKTVSSTPARTVPNIMSFNILGQPRKKENGGGGMRNFKFI